jgi:hypothetical protein
VEQKLPFQKRIGPLRLEIAGIDDEVLGSIYYESRDRRFQDGGLDLVLEAAAAVLEALGREERLGTLFFGPFEPVVPPGSPRLEQARVMFQDFRAQLASLPQVEVGDTTTLPGVWLDLSAGVDRLRTLAAQCAGLSAEDSRLRLLVLERPDEMASGWDLMHENGATRLGRWEQNVRERPGSVDAKESATLEFALEAVRTALERRPGQL